MDREPPAPGAGPPDPSRGLGRLAGAFGALRPRGLIDLFLRQGALWFVLALVAFVGLTWRAPWTATLEDPVEGRIADADLVSPFDVEIPDEVRTGGIREQARRAVDEVYLFEERAHSRLDRELQEGFASGDLPGSPDPTLVGALRRPPAADAFATIRQIVRTTLTSMIVARSDTLPQGRGITVRYLGEPTEIALRETSTILDLEEARRRAREAVRRIGSLDSGAAALAGDWVASLVQPTLTHDVVETRRRMEEAARQVPVLFSRIPRGKVLARKGQPLNGDVIREIKAVKEASPRGFDATTLLGTLLVVLILTLFLWRHASDSRNDARSVRHLFPFLVLTIVVHAGLARGALFLIDRLVGSFEFPFDRPETHWYLIPVASGAVLVTLLAGERVATVYSLFASVVFAILFDWNLPYAVFALLSHLAGVYGVTKYHARSALLKAGIVVGVSGAAVAAGLSAIGSGFNPWQIGLTDALFAFLGGAIGVPVVVAFLLPIFEWLFGVLTDIRLLELSNVDNPLLSELALRAPGSYNHSIIVGTLAESAAEAIGANTLFCRVAAYYHDIGKMKMPEYYIENQKPGENPHDKLAPSMSALILSNHVKEGIRLGRKHGLPEAILDIIPQHHGTRVMTYFYEKARTVAAASGETPPNPDDFRHQGPKPATKEAAIFMLADSVEAAARTVSEPTDDRFRDLIRQITGRVILDGQLDRCDLTFRDLDRIAEAFVRCLGSVYHHRIDYPTFIFKGTAASRRAGRAAIAERAKTAGMPGEGDT